jgi:hypothetical protein
MEKTMIQSRVRAKVMAVLLTVMGTAMGTAVMLSMIPAVSAQPSPPKDVTAVIGEKNIRIRYYSPSMRGRKIYGSLVPYGEVWCPGANWATTITVDSDFQLGSLKLAKGSYAMWVVPNEKSFELIINSDAKAFHLDYKAESDLGKMKMNLKTLDQPVEQLTFEIRSDGANKATVALIWENTEASVPLSVTP